MNTNRKIEFFVTPDGRVMIDELGVGMREYVEGEQEMTWQILDILSVQYPDALEALRKEYESSRFNKMHQDYLCAHRFIRCNFGRFDGLTYDIDGQVMHVEEVQCPIKRECPMKGVICKPKPFGLSEREALIARMMSSGMTYEEISAQLGIKHSTIKNFIQRAKEKLKLSSSKDIAKIVVATL